MEIDWATEITKLLKNGLKGKKIFIKKRHLLEKIVVEEITGGLPKTGHNAGLLVPTFNQFSIVSIDRSALLKNGAQGYAHSIYIHIRTVSLILAELAILFS